MAVIQWSIDQGRQKYLDINVIRSIAAALVPYDGTPLVTRPDPLISLLRTTQLEDVPTGYQVWRQYSRLFRLLLLAAEVGGTRGRGTLKITDMCLWLAGALPGGAPTVDEYLIHYSQRFYSPPPISVAYSATAPRVFPICALMRFMSSRIGISTPLTVKQVTVPLDEIFTFVVGNNCVGNEDARHYKNLSATTYSPPSQIRRHTRELLNLIGQLSFVEWEPSSNRLTCDFSGFTAQSPDRVFTPVIATQTSNVDLEVLSLGGLRRPSKPGHAGAVPPPTPPPPLVPMQPGLVDIDESFAEGSRVRVTHLKIERDAKLRKLYFQHVVATGQQPQCDMCGLRVTSQYPWASSDHQLLEIHHLLPLASTVAVGATGTSLSDLVPLCPTCHRAVHAFYRNALKATGLEDFPDKATACATYQAAKKQKRP